MNQPRQQHYLPRFYLQGFCDPQELAVNGKEILWVYEKGKPIRSSNPNREAKIRDYYTLERDGERDLQVEYYLGQVEEKAAPIIRRASDSTYEISQSERESLALFVGTMFTRTPNGRAISETKSGPEVSRRIVEAAQSPERFLAMCKSMTPPEEFAMVDVESVRLDILNGSLDPHARSPELELFSVIAVGKISADALIELDWQFIYADESEQFLTSDNPVVSGIWDESRQLVYFRTGFGVAETDIYCPLTRTLCLRMKNNIGSGSRRLRAERAVRYINKSTMICARKFVYASEKSVKLQKLFNKRGAECSVESFQPTYPESFF